MNCIDKQILFMWFGDEKPRYVDWNIQNFKTMNPSWKITFKEYSKDQILNNASQLNDNILLQSISIFNDENKKHTADSYQKTLTFLADIYKYMYLKNSTADITVNCDLDCFPIAPLDDFFVLTNNIDDVQKTGYYINNHNIIELDSWFQYKSMNFKTKFNMFMLMPKNVNMSQHICFNDKFDQFLTNGNNMQLDEYQKRKHDFYACNLKTDDPFCNPFFTPIEHYRSAERNKIKQNNIGNYIYVG